MNIVITVILYCYIQRSSKIRTPVKLLLKHTVWQLWLFYRAYITYRYVYVWVKNVYGKKKTYITYLQSTILTYGCIMDRSRPSCNQVCKSERKTNCIFAYPFIYINYINIFQIRASLFVKFTLLVGIVKLYIENLAV